jgi:hypothetical protein
MVFALCALQADARGDADVCTPSVSLVGTWLPTKPGWPVDAFTGASVEQKLVEVRVMWLVEVWAIWLVEVRAIWLVAVRAFGAAFCTNLVTLRASIFYYSETTHSTKKHATKKHATKKHATKKHATKKHATKKHATKKSRVFFSDEKSVVKTTNVTTANEARHKKERQLE